MHSAANGKKTCLNPPFFCAPAKIYLLYNYSNYREKIEITNRGSVVNSPQSEQTICRAGCLDHLATSSETPISNYGF